MKNYKNIKLFNFNILVKGKNGEKDRVIKIKGDGLLFDGGSINVSGENDDMIIIGVNDNRKVFSKMVDGNWGVI
jgi:hypothetical protein